MESYEQMLSRAYSAQLSQAQISRRRSQRTMSRPQPSSSRPTRVEKSSSRHTSPNSLLLRQKTGASTLPHSQEVQYNQPTTRPMARTMARLDRPLSWHATSTSQMTLPTYYQPATMHTTPSIMGRSSYDWPEDGSSSIMPEPQPSANYYNGTSPYSATTVQQESSIDFSHPVWINPAFDNTTTYPLPQVNFPYQAYAAPHSSQPLQMTMPYFNSSESWQEVPGLEDDASPSVEESPGASGGEELVGLGLYDKTVRTSTDLLGCGVKSLKLTEGWTPPGGEQSQTSSAQSSSYVTPTGHHENLPFEQQKPSTMIAQQAYPFDLSDHSFLFNNDNYGTEWYGAQQMGAGNNGNRMGYYG